MKTRFGLALVMLIFFISISPLAWPFRSSNSKADGVEEITSDQNWNADRVIDKDIIIKSGVNVTVGKGVSLTFDNAGMIVNGNLFLFGTSKDPVILKKNPSAATYSILVPTGGNLQMRNVDFSGAGESLFLGQNDLFINAANAYYTGGIQMNGGTLDAQECSFHDNEVAIFINVGSHGKIVVNRSKFFNNSLMDVGYVSSSSEFDVNFKYNWWGSADGPSQLCYEVGVENVCYRDKMDGAIDFSNWLKEKDFHDPVVIIPGIFGSQQKNGAWEMDPIFHVYDNLFDEFTKNGYVSGKDLFVFPYDWRDSNVENAIKLRYKIAEIKTITNWAKVDLVAHSMGGLLAREYVESNAFQKDVDQLITLGTPNNGSPEIYPLWEAGYPIGTVQTGMKRFMEQEREEAGFADMFSYVRGKPIKSAQELLPNYEYLFDVDQKRPMIYPAEYPQNVFLDSLNAAGRLMKMKNVEYSKIVGKTNSDISTISGFNLVKVNMGEKWLHGYPLSFEIPIIGDRGVINGFGDGTVPISSSKSDNVFSDLYLELNSAHTDLPTDAQKDVLEILTGVRPTSEVKDSMIKNMLQFFVHSPIDIQIISPSGKRVGKNFETSGTFNEIEGAFYSGFETDNEFVTIPNPEDGEYRILTEGKGDGNFRVEAVKIFEDPVDATKSSEAVAIVNGTATLNAAKELKVSVIGNLVTDSNAPSAPVDPPAPELPPVLPPPAPLTTQPSVPEAPNLTPTPSVTQNNDSGSGHKKSAKKHKKKAKKTKVAKAVMNVKKVLGITKTWNLAAKKTSNIWQNVTKNVKTWKDAIFSPLKYFKK